MLAKALLAVALVFGIVLTVPAGASSASRACCVTVAKVPECAHCGISGMSCCQKSGSEEPLANERQHRAADQQPLAPVQAVLPAFEALAMRGANNAVCAAPPAASPLRNNATRGAVSCIWLI
jgi:hypothetical protein